MNFSVSSKFGENLAHTGDNGGDIPGIRCPNIPRPESPPLLHPQAGEEYRLSQPCTSGMHDKWQDSWDKWQETTPFVASEYLQFQHGAYSSSPNSYPSNADGEGRRGTMLDLQFRLSEAGGT